MLFYPYPPPRILPGIQYGLRGCRTPSGHLVVTHVCSLSSDDVSKDDLIGVAVLSTAALEPNTDLVLIVNEAGYPMEPTSLMKIHPVVLYRPVDYQSHHLYSLFPLDVGIPFGRDRISPLRSDGGTGQVLEVINTFGRPTSKRRHNFYAPRITIPSSVSLCSRALQSICLSSVSAVPSYIKGMSTTVDQISHRASAIALLHSQAPTHEHRPELNNVYDRSRYINFYNIIWLVLNDFIFGWTIGSILCENENYLGTLALKFLKKYTVELPKSAMEWLNSWPLGFKLNTDLSLFFASTFSFIISKWDHIVLKVISNYLSQTIFVLGSIGIWGGGLTAMLAVLSDLLSLSMVHLYVTYRLATVIFGGMKNILGGLFDVFRGKRKNVLRNRLDSFDYSIDQLLLGTVLFTLSLFLFPTVLAYYLCFSLMRSAVLAAQAMIGICLALLNRFPLFAIMLRLKDPNRLPGGISLRVVHPKDAQGTGYLMLDTQPISFRHLFSTHLSRSGQPLARLDPIRLVHLIVQGKVLSTN
ncbi:N-acetylglucosaminyltransferase complex, subunit PIG-Q/GPI1, required for phosphatidylinositol biosynthesis [Phaffia rhodozyma]|uniref:N-acetylglucosaminyltransferase complex, subunit PIG-Q/GPI1, required for phosphatidylinositol biosynthesis n=1 Tax=Phaffia rhodozyma TaxID=264483 RepID=A0A0F7SF23_PHARH|nr:N-acetylglucosaminyltransferase complex, subunit PIG-Q/GPI1, required for phosphatidylinositol biosynthesis [Phaffia rhodozyma]